MHQREALFFDVVSSGNVASVERALINNVNIQVNAQQADGMTALNVACKEGYYKIACLLIEKNADVYLASNSGESPLLSAVGGGYVDIIHLLLDTMEQNASQNDQIQKEIAGAFIQATTCGRDEVVKVLLDRGAPINYIDENEWSGLYCAAVLGHVSIVKLLLRANADPTTCPLDFKFDYRDETPDTPGWHELKKIHDEILQILQEHYRIIATEQNQVTLGEVCKLLDRGMSPNVKSKDGNSLLHICVDNGDRGLLQKLKNCQGLDIDQVDRDGQTALWKAVKEKKYDLVSDFIGANANVNIVDKHGVAPIHLAVNEGDAIMLTQLAFAYIVDINIFDKSGLTPLHKATMNNREDLVSILIEAKADPHLLSKSPADSSDYPKLALTIAIKDNRSSIAKLLYKAMYPPPRAVPKNVVSIVDHSPIGSGSTAQVLLAKYQNKLVALKTPPRNRATADILRIEIKKMKTCPSPYIIPLLDFVDEEEENPIMILTLMDKGDLRGNMKNLKFSIHEILKVVANALKDLHECGQMHRDINPNNIFLCSTNYIKVGDLGSSRPCAELMTQGVGTLMYIAPEVIKDSPYDYAADIYSFGAVLYELTTEEVPFADKKPLQIMSGLQSENSGLRLKLPQKYTSWLMALGSACLQYNPKDRPTAKQIVDFLCQIPSHAQNDKFSPYIVPQETLNLLVPQ